MQLLIKDDTQIAKAHNEYKNFTQDKNLRELYESRVRWKMDHDTDIAIAAQEGEKRGEIRGELKNQQNVLIKLIEKKFGINENESKIIRTIEDLTILDKALEYILFAEEKKEVLKYLK